MTGSLRRRQRMLRAMRSWLLLASMAAGLTAMDIPVVTEDVIHHGQVVIRNPIDRAVRISVVDVSCSCISATPVQQVLLPSGTAAIDIALSKHQRRSGLRTGTIYVQFTDPTAEQVLVELSWYVIPYVTVDVLLPGVSSATRPEAAARDVYLFRNEVRPDEPNRLRRRLLVGSPAEQAPPGGLQITGVEYQGPLWAFTTERQADGTWLVHARAKDEDADLPLGSYREQAILLTNHPQRPRIALYFETEVQTDAGRHRQPLDPGLQGPFGP